jgi:hypothetical protein
VKCRGRGVFQIDFEELDMPATTGLEVHVDLVRAIVAVHKSSIGEQKENIVHSVKDGQRKVEDSGR